MGAGNDKEEMKWQIEGKKWLASGMTGKGRERQIETVHSGKKIGWRKKKQGERDRGWGVKVDDLKKERGRWRQDRNKETGRGVKYLQAEGVGDLPGKRLGAKTRA